MLQVKKKFDSNIHLLYYLSGTNHIFATLVYNFFFFFFGSKFCHNFNIFHLLNGDLVRLLLIFFFFFFLWKMLKLL